MNGRKARHYKWQVAGFLALLGALNYADRTALNSVFPLLKQDLHLSDVQLAATGTVFLWTYGLLSPFAGYIADQCSRSRLIILSVTGWSAVTLLTGFVTTATSLLVTRALLAITECLYIPAAIALVADYHKSPTRATAVSFQICGTSVGMVAGGTLAGYLGGEYGWRASFRMLGAFGFILAIVASQILSDVTPIPGRRESQPQRKDFFRSLLRDFEKLLAIRAYQVIVVQGIVQAIAVWTVIHWLPLYFKESFEISLLSAGFFGTFLLNSGQLTGTLVGGYSSDQFAIENVLRRMLLQGVGYIVSAPFLLAFWWSPGFATTAAIIFLFGLIRSLANSNENPFVCDLLPSGQRSQAIGFMNLSLSLGSGLGVLISGYFKQDFGLPVIFASASVLMLTSGFILICGYRALNHARLSHSSEPVGKST